MSLRLSLEPAAGFPHPAGMLYQECILGRVGNPITSNLRSQINSGIPPPAPGLSSWEGEHRNHPSAEHGTLCGGEVSGGTDGHILDLLQTLYGLVVGWIWPMSFRLVLLHYFRSCQIAVVALPALFGDRSSLIYKVL